MPEKQHLYYGSILSYVHIKKTVRIKDTRQIFFGFVVKNDMKIFSDPEKRNWRKVSGNFTVKFLSTVASPMIVLKTVSLQTATTEFIHQNRIFSLGKCY
jgi:ribosomal protein L39E